MSIGHLFLGCVRAASAAALVLAFSPVADADTIRFVPPTDPEGRIYSTNGNDGWAQGRGVVFTATEPVALTSVAVLVDLSNIRLSYRLAGVTRTEGAVRRGSTALRNGVSRVTTSGLDWVTFAFSPLRLSAGHGYLLEFTFSGDGNQNFFHRNCAAPADPNACDGQLRYSVGPFADVDGTHEGNTANFVQPAVRVDIGADASPVPEPSTLALLCVSIAALGRERSRRKAATETGGTTCASDFSV